MGTQNNLVAKAVRYALATGVAATFVAAPTYAADEEKGEKIVVTGSRIKRVDIEGPSPITVIGRDEIDQSGDNSVADVLRSSVFNSFGSFRERSGVGNGATGNATVSLRGLGASRTLILIDGKRAPSSPSFGGGGAQNLNLIPVSAVERIEILRDGASAIYGSDALAGVINIILRKDFDGLVLTAGAERPTEEGADGSSFSLSTGVTSGKGNITFVLDHVERKQLFNKDRDFTSVGLSIFGFPGTFFAYETDPVSGARTNYIGTFPDARCPTNLGDSAEFPNSLLRFGGAFCGFNYAATSAHSAALARDTVFISTNYEISDSLNFNSRVMLTKTKSFGRYAPAPGAGGFPAGLFPTMAADNVNNPTNPVTGDPRFIGGGGPYELDIAYRNVPGGPRDSNVTDTLTDILVGLQGTENWGGGTDWELNVHHSRSRNVDLGTGYGFGSLMQAAIDDESYDVFNINGNFSEAIAQSFGHETVFEAEVVNFSFDGNIVFDLFETDAGTAPLVLGFEYDDLNFFQFNDPQSNSGNVFGTSGGDNVFASRFRKSIYAESVIPVTDTIEVDVALRFDDYSDFGSTVNPKISAAWRPTDELLVRASFGKGFRAPTMTQLFGNQSQSFNSATDHYGCSIGLPNTCATTQYQNFNGGNPNLDAETSESFTAGVVYNPFDDFSVGLNYFTIDLEDGFGTPGLQSILNNDRDLRAAGGAGDSRVVRAASGAIQFINRFVSNTNKFEITGIDLDLDWGGIDAGEAGEFAFQFELSQTLDFDSIDANGASSVGVGEFFADGTAQPEYKAQLNTVWTMGDWGASMQIQFIPSMENPDSGDTLDSWTTFDVQVTYSTDWDGKFVIGARNLSNEEPPINTTTMDSPFYADTVHDIFGRIPYIRYEQSF